MAAPTPDVLVDWSARRVVPITGRRYGSQRYRSSQISIIWAQKSDRTLAVAWIDQLIMLAQTGQREIDL
jgi:hypothetical protein